MANIVLDLDRKDISVTEFTEAFNAQIRLVREVMIEMGIPANEVRWIVADLKFGSTYAAAMPQIVGIHAYMADVEAAMKNAGMGLNSLASSSARPAFFNDEALKLSRKLVDLVNQSDAGKARLTFGEELVAPSQHVTANVAAIIKGDLPSIGSIEGQLIGVEGADGSYRIAIRDRLRNRKVPCVINADQLKKALKNYEKRVIVRGKIWSREDGMPVRIEVRSFDPIPTDDELPTRQEVRGILRDFRRADGE